MSLTYDELLAIASVGERLRKWKLAFPCREDGLGLRILRDGWQFISAAEIEVDRNLSLIVQDVISKRG